MVVIIRSTLMHMPPSADSTSARLFQELDMEVAQNTVFTSQRDWKGTRLRGTLGLWVPLCPQGYPYSSLTYFTYNLLSTPRIPLVAQIQTTDVPDHPTLLDPKKTSSYSRTLSNICTPLRNPNNNP